MHKFGVHIAQNEKEALMLDCENGNTYWLDAVKAETGQLFEHKVFGDLGKERCCAKGLSAYQTTNSV